MMNCPKCGEEITKLLRHCHECRTDFGEELHDKFAFYFGLKEELAKLTDLQNSLFSGIANVTARIDRYEQVLRHDLTSISVRQDPVQTKPGKKRGKKKR